MPLPDTTAVGRKAELETLRAALGAVMGDGSGSLWLIAGEPGIGKSRLAQEAARAAREMGLSVLVGQCWEVGGAPAYWPWLQVLRGVTRLGPPAEQVSERYARDLAQILPELKEHAGPSSTALEPDQAKFQLLDAATRLLFEVAEHFPLLVVLEDVHAADPASLILLEFLAKQLRTASVCVIATYRDVEANRGPSGAVFARFDAERIALGPLSAQDVREYLAATAPDNADELADVLFRRTEGNPLFMVETTRLLTAGALAHRRRPIAQLIPNTVRSVLRERLEQLAPDARAVLEVAAASGRDFRTTLIARAMERPIEEVHAALSEACDAQLLVPTSDGMYRFSHVLVRDVLHHELPDARRFTLHRKLAEVLETLSPGVATPWSELAHHYLNAGAEARHEAIDAASKAAESAIDQLAFDDAVTWYGRALDALDQIAGSDRRRRAELLVGLGHAEIRAGNIAGGHQACRSAADLARLLGDAELLAEAALVYGAAFHYAAVDYKLVALLREALDALEDTDSPLRARTMARLAAAEQPALDPRPPMELARNAIAMARRLGDDETLLATLRSGVSALMDLGDPEERLLLNREHVALAERLSNPVESMRGQMRQVFDSIELGDAAGVHAAIEGCDRLAKRLARPHYAWVVTGLRGMCAIRAGRFSEAETLSQEARRLGQSARDPNVHRTLAMQRSVLLGVSGRHEELVALLPELECVFSTAPGGGAITRVLTAGNLALAGRSDEAAAHVHEDDARHVLSGLDASLVPALTFVAIAKDLENFAEDLYEVMLQKKNRTVSGGLLGLTWEEPVSRFLGQLAAYLGRFDSAERHYDEALAAVRASGAHGYEPWIAHDYARVLLERGGTDRRERARTLLHDAAERARELQIHTLPEQIAQALRALSNVPTEMARRTPAAEPVHFTLERRGELWTIVRDDSAYNLRDTKGIQMLSRLIEAPGRELHVLDLVASGSTSPKPDGGDSGDVLDERARSEYRARAESIQQQIAEADEWNDTGRAERLRGELDALTRELSRAVGLGGRSRRVGSNVERARINVQRRLKDAIRRVDECDRALGRHLERSVRTGTYCAYEPE